MLEGYAEYYSAELSQKIRRGQQENALKCKCNGGIIPFGYRVDPKEHTFVIDPEEAPIVKEIFSRYAAGEPMADIVAYSGHFFGQRCLIFYTGADTMNTVREKAVCKHGEDSLNVIVVNRAAEAKKGALK